MTQALAGQQVGLRVVELADGVRIHLPARDLGRLRWIGLGAIVLGLLFAIVPIVMAYTAWQDDAPLLFMLAPLLFLIPTAFLIMGGAFVLAGRAEVELTRDRLRYTERWGLLRLRWQRRPADVHAFAVGTLGDEQGNFTDRSGQLPPAIARIATLIARTRDGKPLLIAAGHPRDVLEAVAQELSRASARYLDEPVPVRAVDDGEASGAAERPPSYSLDDLPAPPAHSTVEFDRHDAGVTLRVPPAGLWRGTKGLFAFSILWCAFVVVFLAIGAWITATADAGDGIPIWIAVPFVLVFGGVGVATLLAAINMGKRRAILDVIDTTLVVSRQGPFGTRQHEWSREELEQIRVGPSGIEVNNRPVMNLQIVPHQGKTVGLLSQRSDDELRWIAIVLQAALRLEPSQ